MQKATKEQARRFLLRKQGLLGEYRFQGKEGVLRYVRQAGCIQFDPIDVCGKSPELALLSRVKNFHKETLLELLYQDRALIDYFDKNLSIFPAEDFPAFSRTRMQYDRWERGHGEIDQVEPDIFHLLTEQKYICSKDFSFQQKIDWPWAPARLSRAALESLYFRGKLAIHHKEGTVKYYARLQDCFPPEVWAVPDPFLSESEYLNWRVKRRIGAVGLLWAKPSDAWLGIDGLSAARRDEAFADLSERGEIVPVQVEGVKLPLYYLAEDEPFWTAEDVERERTEFLAPLDCLLWDRNLIRELFGFSYKWEIYTPEVQRKYGYYVLPVLRGDRFAGRIEAVRNLKSGTLLVKHFWPEPGVRESKALKRAVAACAKRLAKFNGCRELLLPPELHID